MNGAEIPDGPEGTAARELFRLASADNFRDVAGPGYPTSDGRRVRSGVCYRSNELQLTHEDATALAGLGLTSIHDLRSADEVAAHPDLDVPGATWRHRDVLGIPMDEVTGLGTLAEAAALMERVYLGFVYEPRARAAFGGLLTAIATEDGPHLFHCTAGKDRTGWAAALLLHVAGVDADTILADYLLSNEYAQASRDRYLTMVATALGDDKVPVYERVLVADADYLATAYAAVAATYGDLDGYLADGLGLDAATRARLAERLVG